jgi:hypothetical protein
MSVDDALHSGQAQAVPGRLGGEERLEDAGEGCLIHARAVVLHVHEGVLARDRIVRTLDVSQLPTGQRLDADCHGNLA